MNIAGKRATTRYRGVVILLLTFSLTLDKSAGKLRPRPFVFFDMLPASVPCLPLRADDSAPALVGRGNKEAARYRTSLNLKLKLISFSLSLSHFLSFSLSSDGKKRGFAFAAFPPAHAISALPRYTKQTVR